jgi:hypothetical protein
VHTRHELDDPMFLCPRCDRYSPLRGAHCRRYARLIALWRSTYERRRFGLSGAGTAYGLRLAGRVSHSSGQAWTVAVVQAWPGPARSGGVSSDGGSGPAAGPRTVQEHCCDGRSQGGGGRDQDDPIVPVDGGAYRVSVVGTVGGRQDRGGTSPIRFW